jgi:Plasmid pRiA4b ORF-3-like protein
MRVLAFEAVMVPYSPLTSAPAGRVSRTIAIREDQTFEQLHEALRLAFGWADPHLYSFWIGPKFWDREALEYTAPHHMEDGRPDAVSARTPILEARLKERSRLSYVFDYGDEWRLSLTVVETWQADGRAYPMLADGEGVPPPQYSSLDEDDEPDEA